MLTDQNLISRGPRFSCRYNSDDADIELISSDNVRFKVHSYRLQSASPVFRSMIALAKSSSQQDPVHLTDTTFERGVIVERALDVIYNMEFDGNPMVYDLEAILSLIEFAKKWEISLITKFIRKDLERDVNSKEGPLYVFDNFVIALKLGENHLAAAYATGDGKNGKLGLGQTGDQWGKGKAVQYYLTDTPKASLSQKHPLLDIHIDDIAMLGNIPHDFFLCIPPTVVWVISRAQALEGKTNFSQEEIIRQLLDLAYPPSEIEETSKKRKSGD